MNSEIVRIDYIDAAIVEAALDDLAADEKSISGYGYQGHQVVEEEFSLEWHRFAMDGNGYHVGTEVCEVKIDFIDRANLTFVNELKEEENRLHKWLVRLDDMAIDLKVDPAIDPDEQCEECEYEPGSEECEMCDSLYYPADEDFYWEGEVGDFIEKLREKVLEYEWCFNDGTWEIIHIPSEPEFTVNLISNRAGVPVMLGTLTTTDNVNVSDLWNEFMDTEPDADDAFIGFLREKGFKVTVDVTTDVVLP